MRRCLLPRELDDPVVEPPRCGVHRLLELGGDEAVRAAEERLGDAVELLAEAIRRLLADRAHPVLELERACFAPCVDLACHRSLEMLHLPALELGERELDPRARLALGAVDLLGHRVLVLAQPLVQLVDRPAAVVRLRRELLERARERVPRARLELLARAAAAAARCSSIVASSSSDSAATFASTSAMRWRMRCSSVDDGALERVLGALEVGLPRAQPLLDALLDGCDELGHALGQLALAHGELAAALVGEPALLGDVRGERVGLRASDRDAELLGLRRRLLLRGGANRAPRLGHELLGARRARARAPQREDEARRRGATRPTSAATRIQARVVTKPL